MSTERDMVEFVNSEVGETLKKIERKKCPRAGLNGHCSVNVWSLRYKPSFSERITVRLNRLTTPTYEFESAPSKSGYCSDCERNLEKMLKIMALVSGKSCTHMIKQDFEVFFLTIVTDFRFRSTIKSSGVVPRLGNIP